MVLVRNTIDLPTSCQSYSLSNAQIFVYVLRCIKDVLILYTNITFPMPSIQKLNLSPDINTNIYVQSFLINNTGSMGMSILSQINVWYTIYIKQVPFKC